MEWVKINGERLRIDDTSEDVHTGDGVACVELSDGTEWYLAKSHTAAEEAAARYWRDMAENDKTEFRCIIGDERLLQWMLGESDSFGISSLEDFLEAVATVPEEELAMYDGHEVEVDHASTDAVALLGFTPVYAYRRD